MRFTGLLVLNSALLVRALSGLPELLSEKGISFVAPEDDNYQNVTTACMFFPLRTSLQLLPTWTSLDNLRFTLKPSIVTFPTNSTQVSDIVKIGSGFNHSIVARSGGVSSLTSLLQLRYLK